MGLEETVKEYENKLRRTLMSRSSDQGEALNFSKMKVKHNYRCSFESKSANFQMKRDTKKGWLVHIGIAKEFNSLSIQSKYQSTELQIRGGILRIIQR